MNDFNVRVWYQEDDSTEHIGGFLDDLKNKVKSQIKKTTTGSAYTTPVDILRINLEAAKKQKDKASELKSLKKDMFKNLIDILQDEKFYPDAIAKVPFIKQADLDALYFMVEKKRNAKLDEFVEKLVRDYIESSK